MILMPCLFLPAPSYLPPEYFLLDICIIVLTLLHHLVLLLHSPGEYHLTPLDSHVQILELGACNQSDAAVAWISRQPSRVSSFQAPCMPLEFPLSKLVSALFLFILVRFLVYMYVSSLLYCSFMYIPCTLAFAHVSDMIFMYYCNHYW